MFFYQNPLKWVKNLEISASSAWDPEQIRFGYSISADSNAELLGVSIYPPSGERENVPNEFYLFSQQEDGQYVQQQVLRPSGLSIAESHNFGTDYSQSPVIYGTSKAVIAVKGVGFGDRGAVAIFRSGSAGYVQEQVLIDEDENTESFSLFGYQMVMSRDSSLLLISNSGNDVGGSNAGKIYLYRDVSGSFQKVQELPRPPNADLMFGQGQCVFAEDMNTLFVAHMYHSTDGGTTRPGAVYVYESGSSGYQLTETIEAVESGFKYLGENISYNQQTKELAVNNISDDWSARKVKIFQSGSNGYQLSQTLGDATVSYNKALFSYDGAKLFLNKKDNTVSVFVDSGSGYTEIEQISLPAGNYFGSKAINENGSRFIFGDGNDDTLATNAGAVYVYESGSNGWTQSQKILPEDDWSPYADGFGHTFELSSNNEILAIAQYDSQDTPWQDGGNFWLQFNEDSVGSSVYIYKKQGEEYEQVQRIQNPSPGVSDFFGSPISLSDSGNKLAVAAMGASHSVRTGSVNDPLDYDTWLNGKVFVYESGSSGYTFAQEIKKDPPNQFFSFGSDVAFNSSGQNLFISAHDQSTGGSVYVYTSGSSGYTQVQELTSSVATPNSYDYFTNIELSKDDEVLLVGELYGDSDTKQNIGSVTIFISGSEGYEEVQRITPDDTIDPDGWGLFGGSGMFITEDKQTIAVGSRSEQVQLDTSIARTGAVRIYQSGSSGYEQVQLITAPAEDPVNGYEFGAAVDISGSYLAISSPADAHDESGGTSFSAPDRGSVWIYEKINGVYEKKYRIARESGSNAQSVGTWNGQSGFKTAFGGKFLPNNEILISSPYDDKNGADSGVVYKYKLTRDY